MMSSGRLKSQDVVSFQLTEIQAAILVYRAVDR